MEAHDDGIVVGWSVPTLSIAETPMYDWAVRGRDILYTSISILEDYANNFDDAKLKGVIFHMSRCGSTAIGNAFRSVGRTLVISESSALTKLLRSDELNDVRLSPNERSLLARGFLAATLKESPANNVVIKFPSFVSLQISETLSLLPPVRWCFSSRTPSEVLASLEREPSGWLRNASKRRDLVRFLTGDAAGHGISLRAVCVRLLTRYLESVLSADWSDADFLDYEYFGVEAVSNVVCSFLGLARTKEITAAVSETLQYYSKAVDRKPFVMDYSPFIETEDAALNDAYERYRLGIAFFGLTASGGAACTATVAAR